MKQRPRIYYTESQKKLMWDHWQKDDSLQQIAQLVERTHSSIQRTAHLGGNSRKDAETTKEWANLIHKPQKRQSPE